MWSWTAPVVTEFKMSETCGCGGRCHAYCKNPNLTSDQKESLGITGAFVSSPTPGYWEGGVCGYGPGNCNDDVQNGDETGRDTGGRCTGVICANRSAGGICGIGICTSNANAPGCEGRLGRLKPLTTQRIPFEIKKPKPLQVTFLLNKEENSTESEILIAPIGNEPPANVRVRFDVFDFAKDGTTYNYPIRRWSCSDSRKPRQLKSMK